MKRHSLSSKNKMQFKKVEEAIKKSWDKKTCHPEDSKKWSEKEPARGQCGVSVLIIQDYFGGEIAFNRKHKHVWNILPNGSHYDIAKDKFPKEVKVEVEGTITRNNMFYTESAKKAKVRKRYDLLSARVKRNLTEKPLEEVPEKYY